MSDIKALDPALRPEVETILDGNAKLVVPILQRQLQNTPDLILMHFLLASSSEVVRRLAFEAIICAKIPLSEEFFIEEVLPLLQQKQLLIPVLQPDMADFLAARRLGLHIDRNFVFSKDMQQGLAFYLMDKYYNQLMSLESGTHHFCVLEELAEYMRVCGLSNFEKYLQQNIVYQSGFLMEMFLLARQEHIEISSSAIAKALEYSLCECRAALLKQALLVAADPDELILQFEDFLMEVRAETLKLNEISQFLLAHRDGSVTDADLEYLVQYESRISLLNKILFAKQMTDAQRAFLVAHNAFSEVFARLEQCVSQDFDLLDKSSILIALDSLAVGMCSSKRLESVCAVIQSQKFTSLELSHAYAVLLRLVAESAEFLRCDAFRRLFRRMLAFAVDNPHMSDFLLSCEHFSDLEVVSAAICAVPGPNLDPQAFELQTLCVLCGGNGAGTNACVRMQLLRCAERMCSGNGAVVDALLALERDTRSLMYADGEARLLEFQQSAHWDDARRLRKQIEFLKMLRRAVIAERYSDTSAACELVRLLGDQRWQRASRTVWEQIISLIYINAHAPFLQLAQITPQQESAVALQSLVMITGHVALGLQAQPDTMDAVWRSLLRFAMCGYNLVRALAKHALQRIARHVPDAIPQFVLAAIESTPEEQQLQLGRIFDQIADLPREASEKDVHFPFERPAIELFANPRYEEDLEDVMSHAQFVVDERALANLRTRMRFTERQVLNSSDPQQQKIVVQSSPKQFQIRVVASLLDNGVNLGGICRTCEVFGTLELIVAEEADLQSQAFKNAAVTAENHLKMSFWPRNKVASEIVAAKQEGWSIVALEQCSGSVPMGSFPFPAKCCLVLGNETFGLPDEILRECDHFVEIPQFGTIRSLNVHVSCAIAVWEFVKQYK